jgi:hypothetical protein
MDDPKAAENLAIEIGEKILGLQHEIVVLGVILDSMRLPDGSPVSWRQMKQGDMPTLLSSPISQEKFDELRQAIHNQTNHNSVLDRLHQHFWGK